jgi:IS5 family transposase
VRIDSTVIEADIKYPTDAGLAAHGVRSLAREGRKLAAKLRETKTRVRDRSRSKGRKLRAITRTIRRRSGEAKAEVLALTQQTGMLLEHSVKEARRLAATARLKARGRGAQAKLRAAAKLDELADRCEKVAKQISQRVAGEKITDRLISLSDPDARPIRKGKLGKLNEFGYVAQIAEVTANTKRGARELILPAASLPGNPVENALLPQTVTELQRLGLSPKEVALDGAFTAGPDHRATQRPPARAPVHLRAPAARPQTHPTQDAALPHRRRRTHQPPQTRLRDAPQPTQRAMRARRPRPDGAS